MLEFKTIDIHANEKSESWSYYAVFKNTFTIAQPNSADRELSKFIISLVWRQKCINRLGVRIVWALLLWFKKKFMRTAFASLVGILQSKLSIFTVFFKNKSHSFWK